MTAMRDAFTVTPHQHRQREDTFLRPNIRPIADGVCGDRLQGLSAESNGRHRVQFVFVLSDSPAPADAHSEGGEPKRLGLGAERPGSWRV